jgi:O-antigen/teichoic acid export membrane protein
MIPLVGINLMASVQVQYLKDEVDNQSYLSSGLRLALGLTILFSIIALIASGVIADSTGVPKEFIYVVAVYALFNTVIEVLLAIWRMEDKAINYGLFRIGRTVFELSIVLVFVIGFELNFEGSIYGMIIAYASGCLVALIILSRKKLLFGSFSKDYLKHAVRYGVPLIPHTLSGVAIMYSDKLILTHYHGLAANGVYTVGFLVGQIIGLLQNSFNQAWVPWVFQKLKLNNQEDKNRMVKMTYIYIMGIVFLVFLLWLIMPFIYSFFNKEYAGGMKLVLWIALGFAFNGMYKMVSVYLFYLERTMIIAYVSLGAALLNVILNFVLIPDYGPEGAAWATTSAFAIQFVITWLISAKLMKMPWLLRS